MLNWLLSNTMGLRLLSGCHVRLLQRLSNPDIFNSDDGAQYTSQALYGRTGRRWHHSLNGLGRGLGTFLLSACGARSNYEDVYLKGYETLTELTVGTSEYIRFYNPDRPHRSLEDCTPEEVYQTGSGCGGAIPDHFGGRKNVAPLEDTGQHCVVATTVDSIA